MKVLLINPPVRDFYDTPMRRQPLGLLYLAAALRQRGHTVELLDSGARKARSRLLLPETLKAITPPGDAMDASPFKLFGRFYHFGPSFKEIAERVKQGAPDVIGIASLLDAWGWLKKVYDTQFSGIILRRVGLRRPIEWHRNR